MTMSVRCAAAKVDAEGKANGIAQNGQKGTHRLGRVNAGRAGTRTKELARSPGPTSSSTDGFVPERALLRNAVGSKVGSQ